MKTIPEFPDYAITKEGIQNMKEVKKVYEECKKRFPNRPPDEIDFGLGWKEALLWFWKVAEHLSPSDCDLLDKELGNDTSKDR